MLAETTYSSELITGHYKNNQMNDFHITRTVYYNFFIFVDRKIMGNVSLINYSQNTQSHCDEKERASMAHRPLLETSKTAVLEERKR